ncbi:MAG: ACP S-malonyltransferase [Puniceicoccales bacterium]|nr:ACP S-malonyltransferase [Puniceicoccales bacterium]
MENGHSGLALLFSGQGSQFVGMGKDFLGAVADDGRGVFAAAEELLGYDLRSICLGGPIEKLTEPEICQPALYVVGYAAFCALRDGGLLGDLRAFAGFSLGEWTALAASGALTFCDGLRAVMLRAKCMEEAGALNPGSMAAAVGADLGRVEEFCSACSLFVANVNASDQVVVSGERHRVREAIGRAAEFGIRRIIPLRVAGAYHSPLMEPARRRFSTHLASLTIGNPSLPILSNVSGAALCDGEEIRRLLLEQITSPVRWDCCMRTAHDLGANRFVECGAGRVLLSLAKKNLPHCCACSAEEAVDASGEP